MLDVLRDSQEPLASANVARRIMERRGLDWNDAVAPRRVTGMVGPTLRPWEGKLVEAVMNGSRTVGWLTTAI